MNVITISRQLGSLGTTLGRTVAARLGWRLVHREIINQAARLAGDPELALATIDELGLLGLEPEPIPQEAYLQAVQQVIKDLAEDGRIIIVGRAGQAILQDHPDALHLRVVAPLEVREQRIVQAHGTSLQGAKAQVADSDRFRASYLQRLYGIRWDDPSLYHLVINTGRVDLETAARIVCTVVHHRPPPKNLLENPLG